MVVIGGGVVGVTTAFTILANSPRAKVTLLERNSGVGQECSYQNGAVLSYSSCDVWPKPSFAWDFVKGIWDGDAKFQHNWKNLLRPSFWMWSLRMLWNCRKSVWEENSQALWKLGQASYQLHAAFRTLYQDKLPVDYNYKYPGTLFLYHSNADFVAGQERGQVLNKTLAQKFVFFPSRKQCAELEPQVEHLQTSVIGCGRNTLETIASHDSYNMTLAYEGIAKNLGLQVLCSADVAGFKVDGKRVKSVTLADGREVEGDKFVICAGMQARELGGKLGWTPPLWAVKGYTMDVSSKQHPITSVLHPSGPFGPYLVPNAAGVRYSYFAEFTAEDDTWTDPAKAQKAESLLKTYTGFQDLEFTRQRACLRPVSCDDLPIIGQFPGLENVYLNIGQGSRGSLLSFGSAMLCAEIVTGSQSPSIDPAPFSPSRFYL